MIIFIDHVLESLCVSKFQAKIQKMIYCLSAKAMLRAKGDMKKWAQYPFFRRVNLVCAV